QRRVDTHDDAWSALARLLDLVIRRVEDGQARQARACERDTRRLDAAPVDLQAGRAAERADEEDVRRARRQSDPPAGRALEELGEEIDRRDAADSGNPARHGPVDGLSVGARRKGERDDGGEAEQAQHPVRLVLSHRRQPSEPAGRDRTTPHISVGNAGQGRGRYSDGPARTTRYPSGSRSQISCCPAFGLTWTSRSMTAPIAFTRVAAASKSETSNHSSVPLPTGTSSSASAP